MSQKNKFALIGILSIGVLSLGYYFYSSKDIVNQQAFSESKRKEISLKDIHRVKNNEISANEKLENFITKNAKNQQHLSDEQKVAILKEKIAELYPDDNIEDLGEAEIVTVNSVKVDTSSSTNQLINDQKAGLQALEDQDSTEILDWK